MARSGEFARVCPSRGVLRKPFAGSVVTAVIIDVVVVAALFVSDGTLDGEVLPLFAGVLGFLLLLGGLQSMYWRVRAAGTHYVVDEIGVAVMVGDGVVQRWRWSEVRGMRLRGRFGWYELLTAHPLSAFPHLEVLSDSGVVRCRPVLLWAGGADEAREKIDGQAAVFRTGEA